MTPRRIAVALFSLACLVGESAHSAMLPFVPTNAIYISKGYFTTLRNGLDERAAAATGGNYASGISNDANFDVRYANLGYAGGYDAQLFGLVPSFLAWTNATFYGNTNGPTNLWSLRSVSAYLKGQFTNTDGFLGVGEWTNRMAITNWYLPQNETRLNIVLGEAVYSVISNAATTNVPAITNWYLGWVYNDGTRIIDAWAADQSAYSWPIIDDNGESIGNHYSSGVFDLMANPQSNAYLRVDLISTNGGATLGTNLSVSVLGCTNYVYGNWWADDVISNNSATTVVVSISSGAIDGARIDLSNQFWDAGDVAFLWWPPEGLVFLPGMTITNTLTTTNLPTAADHGPHVGDALRIVQPIGKLWAQAGRGRRSYVTREWINERYAILSLLRATSRTPTVGTGQLWQVKVYGNFGDDYMYDSAYAYLVPHYYVWDVGPIPTSSTNHLDDFVDGASGQIGWNGEAYPDSTNKLFFPLSAAWAMANGNYVSGAGGSTYWGNHPIGTGESWQVGFYTSRSTAGYRTAPISGSSRLTTSYNGALYVRATGDSALGDTNAQMNMGWHLWDSSSNHAAGSTSSWAIVGTTNFTPSPASTNDYWNKSYSIEGKSILLWNFTNANAGPVW